MHREEAWSLYNCNIVYAGDMTYTADCMWTVITTVNSCDCNVCFTLFSACTVLHYVVRWLSTDSCMNCSNFVNIQQGS